MVNRRFENISHYQWSENVNSFAQFYILVELGVISCLQLFGW